jgi:hypothetical protein
VDVPPGAALDCSLIVLPIERAAAAQPQACSAPAYATHSPSARSRLGAFIPPTARFPTSGAYQAARCRAALPPLQTGDADASADDGMVRSTTIVGAIQLAYDEPAPSSVSHGAQRAGARAGAVVVERTAETLARLGRAIGAALTLCGTALPAAAAAAAAEDSDGPPSAVAAGERRASADEVEVSGTVLVAYPSVSRDSRVRQPRDPSWPPATARRVSTPARTSRTSRSSRNLTRRRGSARL